MTRETIKILLAGSRHTGKGQIGRAWGRTDADQPTLQPVILYDRVVTSRTSDHRVVAWVLSFDPEFEDIRRCLYKNTDGIIYTFTTSGKHGDTLSALNGYEQELVAELGMLPPAMLAKVTLSRDDAVIDGIDARANAWASTRGEMPVVAMDYTDAASFQAAVDHAFDTLLGRVLKAPRVEKEGKKQGA